MRPHTADGDCEYGSSVIELCHGSKIEYIQFGVVYHVCSINVFTAGTGRFHRDTEHIIVVLSYRPEIQLYLLISEIILKPLAISESYTVYSPNSSWFACPCPIPIRSGCIRMQLQELLFSYGSHKDICPPGGVVICVGEVWSISHREGSVIKVRRRWFRIFRFALLARNWALNTRPSFTNLRLTSRFRRNFSHLLPRSTSNRHVNSVT